ncbi:MAG: hypothetical protein IH582_14380 [Afipia sp.]|jgi:hypothetical protein|nr:hypothetical protein [Afipia sp.]
MKKTLLSPIALIGLVSFAHADEPAVWRGATMLECSPTSFKPEPQVVDKDPVYKILISVDVDPKMNVQGMMVEHYTAFGQVYSRGQQYDGIRFISDTDKNVKFLKWAGMYKKSKDVGMVGFIFFDDGHWNYAEKTENSKTGEKKWMYSFCHDAGGN